jgi:Outer membrane protein beta-barrel domain
MKFLICVLLLFSELSEAQRWHVNITGGMSNYSGDLQAKRYTFDQALFAFGVGVQYDITRNFSATSTISFMKVGGSDQFNSADLVFRNLSFQTNIIEWNLLAEYTFLDITQSRFSPFVFGGIAVYHFDPYAFDSTGQKVYLKPLSTEGEGLPEYPGQKPYSLTQFAIPFGGGIKFRASENIVFAFEIGLRKTFTDYLDDVSTVYVDETILQRERGPLAVEMAYRAGELKSGNPAYPVAGTARGGPKYLDWYYYTGIRVSIALISRHDGYYGRGRTDCPPKVQ